MEVIMFLGTCLKKIYVLNRSKDVTVKIFYMITAIYEIKTLRKHISCNFICKFNRTTYNSNQKCNNKNINASRESIVQAKKL